MVDDFVEQVELDEVEDEAENVDIDVDALLGVIANDIIDEEIYEVEVEVLIELDETEVDDDEEDELRLI